VIRNFLLAGIILLMIAMLRISALAVHVDLPRPSSHQNGYYDYEGVIHWHTEYTRDAFGSYQDLATIGNQFHLDFLISTEHNNLLALYNHEEGWHGRMLTLVGIESTRKEGYLLGINFHRYTTHDLPTDSFLSEVSRQGGFTLIAHPKNPRWHWRGNIDDRIAGQEIIDLTDQFTTASVLSIVTGILYYPFNKPAGFIQVYHRPVNALKMWDQVTAQRHFIGIYAPDVHQSLRLWGKHIIRFPRAEDALPIAHNHVILRTPFTGNFVPDKTMLLDAIKQGQLYIAIDSLQDATGFFFSARQGDKTAWMGDQLPAGFKTDFFVTLPEPLGFKDTIINVYHNGQKIFSNTASAYTFQATLPGAYRIEVECEIPTFWGFKKNVVWIYSNPIYLR
jgi:hypothetical protein